MRARNLFMFLVLFLVFSKSYADNQFISPDTTYTETHDPRMALPLALLPQHPMPPIFLSPEPNYLDLNLPPIPNFTRVNLPPPVANSSVPKETDLDPAFSAAGYILQLRECRKGVLSIGVDIIEIKGKENNKCHVIYKIAGREISCNFTKEQLAALTSTKRYNNARAMDNGLGILLQPIMIDSPTSPLFSCKQ